jgi:hypothetical protein
MLSLRNLVPARFDRTEINAGHFEYVVPNPVKVTDPKVGASAGIKSPDAGTVGSSDGVSRTAPEVVSPGPPPATLNQSPQGGSNAANRP